jgi:hypothetical protein
MKIRKDLSLEEMEGMKIRKDLSLEEMKIRKDLSL